MSEKHEDYFDSHGKSDSVGDSEENVLKTPEGKISVFELLSDPSFGDNLTIRGRNWKSETSFKFDAEVLGETTIRLYKIRQSKINTSLHTKETEGETSVRSISVNKLEDTLKSVKPKTNLTEASSSTTRDESRFGSVTLENLNKIIRSSVGTDSEASSAETDKLRNLFKIGIHQENIPSLFYSDPKVTDSLPEPEFSAVRKKSLEFKTESGCLADSTFQNSSDTRTEICSSKSQTEKDQSVYQDEVSSSKVEVEICPPEFRDEQSVSEIKSEDSLTESESRCHTEDQAEISVSIIPSEDFGSESQSEECLSGTPAGMQPSDTGHEELVFDSSSFEYSFRDTLVEKVSVTQDEGRLTVASKEEHGTYCQNEELLTYASAENSIPFALHKSVAHTRTEGRLSDDPDEEHLPDIQNVDASHTQSEEQLPNYPASNVSETHSEGRPLDTAAEDFLVTHNKETLDNETGDPFPEGLHIHVSDNYTKEILSDASDERHFLGIETNERLSGSSAAEVSETPTEGILFDSSAEEQVHLPDTQTEETSDILTEDRFADSLPTEVSVILTERRLYDASDIHCTDTQTLERLPDSPVENVSATQTEMQLPDVSTEEASGSRIEDSFPDDPAVEVLDPSTEREMSYASVEEHFPDTQTEKYLEERLTTTLAGEAANADTGGLLSDVSAEEHVPDFETEEASGSPQHFTELLTSETHEDKTESSEARIEIIKTHTSPMETQNEKCCMKTEIQLSPTELFTNIPNIQDYFTEAYVQEVTPDVQNEICQAEAEKYIPQIQENVSFAKTEIKQSFAKTLDAKHLEAPSEQNISGVLDDLGSSEAQIPQSLSAVVTGTTEAQAEVSETHLQRIEFPEVQTEVLETQTESAEVQNKVCPPRTETTECLSEVHLEILENIKLETQAENSLSEIQNESLKRSKTVFLIITDDRPPLAKSEYLPKVDDEHPLQSISKTDSLEESCIKTHSKLLEHEELPKAGPKLPEQVLFSESQHRICGMTSESPQRNIPGSPKTVDTETECSSQDPSRRKSTGFPDQESESQRLTAQYITHENSTADAFADNIEEIQYSNTNGTASPAYVAGDKICEFWPFVYVLNNLQVDLRCSCCFKAFGSSNKTKCNSCSCAYYCNRDCKIKHSQIHIKECPYLRRAGRRNLPNGRTRLLAQALWKLEDPSAQKICCTVGNETYYYRNLPSNKHLLTSNEGIELYVKEEYDALRKFVSDTSISFKEFLELFAKVSRHMTTVIEAPGEDIGIAMYFGLAVIEHSCRPNANITFIGTTAQIIACRDIEVADPNTVTLRFVPLTLDTEERHFTLRTYARGPCYCALCQTEIVDEVLNEVKSEDIECTLIRTVNRISECVDKFGKYEELLTIARETLSAVEGEVGNFNYLRGRILEFALDISLAVEDYHAALTHSRELLSIYLYVFGDNHPAIVNILLDHAISFAKIGIRDLARDYYSEALQVAYNSYGCEHPFFKSIRYVFIQQEETNWEHSSSQLQPENWKEPSRMYML